MGCAQMICDTIRRGKGCAWSLETSSATVNGYTVDNLDKKLMDEATDDFERVFITLRKVLEQNESRCMDSEEDRLDVCQKVAEEFRRSRSQIFKDKK